MYFTPRQDAADDLVKSIQDVVAARIVWIDKGGYSKASDDSTRDYLESLDKFIWELTVMKAFLDR